MFMSINLNTKFWNFSHRNSYQKVLIDSCILYNKETTYFVFKKEKLVYSILCYLFFDIWNGLVITYQLTELMRNSKIIFRMEEQNRNRNTSYAIKKQMKIPSIARVLVIRPTYRFSLQCLVSNQQSIATNAWTKLESFILYNAMHYIML